MEIARELATRTMCLQCADVPWPHDLKSSQWLTLRFAHSFVNRIARIISPSWAGLSGLGGPCCVVLVEQIVAADGGWRGETVLERKHRERNEINNRGMRRYADIKISWIFIAISSALGCLGYARHGFFHTQLMYVQIIIRRRRRLGWAYIIHQSGCRLKL